MVTAERPEVTLSFELRGGNKEVFAARDQEILVEGPAGTGKTRTILELLNLLAHTFPGMRALIVRKHQVTLTLTCLVTFNKRVLHQGDGVSFYGGSKEEAAAYRYPNGSRIVVGGMDNPDKVLSSEYDIIYCNEATELTLEDWEMLTSRLRNGVLKHQRIIGDCNPSAQSHWLNRRCEEGKTRRIKTRLEDNPEYYKLDGTPTDQGQEYIDKLDALSGSRYERLRLGLWVGPENAIYSHFDRSIHVRDLEPGLRFVDGAIGVDYGRRHACGAVPIRVDQYGRRWVCEAWGQPADDHGAELRRTVGSQRARYMIRRGRVDPNQDVLAGQLGFSLADGSAGSRNRRTQVVGRLLNVFPGGRVPPSWLELNEKRFLAEFPQPPFNEADSPGLLLVAGAPGIDELCEQMEAYHEVFVQSETKEDFVVARINDDLVAALEYGCEELDSRGAPLPTRARIGQPAAAGYQGVWKPV